MPTPRWTPPGGSSHWLRRTSTVASRSTQLRCLLRDARTRRRRLRRPARTLPATLAVTPLLRGACAASSPSCSCCWRLRRPPIWATLMPPSCSRPASFTRASLATPAPHWFLTSRDRAVRLGVAASPRACHGSLALARTRWGCPCTSLRPPSLLRDSAVRPGPRLSMAVMLALARVDMPRLLLKPRITWPVPAPPPRV